MAEYIYKTRISSCFMHFDGVTEQLCEVTLKLRLRNFLSVGQNGPIKLKCNRDGGHRK